MRIKERDGTESRAEIAPLASAVYPPEVLATIVWRDVVSARATRRIMIYDDSNLVSAAGLLFRDAKLDGAPMRIAGIGGVMTLPQVQRKGFGRAAMPAAQEVMKRDTALVFGLLFCEPKNMSFYEPLGWRDFPGTVIAEQPGASGPYRVMPAMVLPLASPAPAAGTIDLCGLPW